MVTAATVRSRASAGSGRGDPSSSCQRWHRCNSGCPLVASELACSGTRCGMQATGALIPTGFTASASRTTRGRSRRIAGSCGSVWRSRAWPGSGVDGAVHAPSFGVGKRLSPARSGSACQQREGRDRTADPVVSALGDAEFGGVDPGPRPHTKLLSALRRRSWPLPRNCERSTNRGAAQQWPAHLHARIRELRKDALRKATTNLAKRWQPTGIDALNVRCVAWRVTAGRRGRSWTG